MVMVNSDYLRTVLKVSIPLIDTYMYLNKFVTITNIFPQFNMWTTKQRYHHLPKKGTNNLDNPFPIADTFRRICSK